MAKKIKKPETGQAQEALETLTEELEREPPPREIGGPAGLEPTRYGDWEWRGRCSDF